MTDLLASDIRIPRSIDECDLAMRLVRDRIADIDRELTTTKAESFANKDDYFIWRGRTERAKKIWSDKLYQLEYWHARLQTDAEPAIARANEKIEAMRAQMHWVIARVTLLAEGAELPKALRDFIEKQRQSLPAGFIERARQEVRL